MAMKRILHLLVGLLSCIILFSCEEETVLTIDQNSLSFADNGGSQSFSLTANKPWTASSNQSWCKVFPSAGEEAASSRITITCGANTTYDERDCIVTFTCSELTKTVSVKQASNYGMIVSQTSYEISEDAQLLEIEVKSNVKFNVTVIDDFKDWISFKTTKSLSTQKVVLDIAANEDFNDRLGRVIISEEEGYPSYTISIKQSYASKKNISFADKNLKEILINAFDSDKDGNISYKEAKAVTSIEGVFGENKAVTSFDEFSFFINVKTIPDSCFQDWSSLSSIILPESIAIIGASCFRGCAELKSLTIPESVSDIGGSAFSDCSNLTSIIIPKAVKSIKESLFSNCRSLVEITLPATISSIGAAAFSGCTSLSIITLPSSLSELGGSAFRDCHNLTNIVVPSAVGIIHWSTFSNCYNLVSIDLPNSLTAINSYAFSGCRSLKSITLPDSVNAIGEYSFSGCRSLESIVIPESVTKIEQHLFENCTSLVSVTLPDSITEIGYYAFSGCSSLSTISLPNTVAGSLSYTFYNCSNLITVNIPQSITGLNGTFSGCGKLSTVDIPNSVTYLLRTFENCVSLESIVIPNVVSTIGDSTFGKCRKLSSITIPASVNSIGDFAFYDCTGLKQVVLLPEIPPVIGVYVFMDTNNCPLYVPADSIDTYKNDAQWKTFASRIQSIP